MGSSLSRKKKTGSFIGSEGHTDTTTATNTCRLDSAQSNEIYQQNEVDTF